MKKLLLSVLFVTIYTLGFSQSKVVCCGNPSATQRFAMLASSREFQLSHVKPLPLHFQSAIGKTITYKTPDMQTATAWELKAKQPTRNFLLVIHEWWGLNDWVKKESEKIYNDLKGEVTVIDLDLYDGKVATTQADAGKYMQAVKEDRAKAIIKGAITHAGPNARIYTIGWCFGGGWSLQSALLAGKQAYGCVMYYGMPEQDVNRLKTLHCDVLGNFANQDQWINTKVVTKFETDMNAAGKKLSVNQYDANHGFANPSNPAYNSTATKDAYNKTIAFFKARL